MFPQIVGKYSSRLFQRYRRSPIKRRSVGTSTAVRVDKGTSMEGQCISANQITNFVLEEIEAVRLRLERNFMSCELKWMLFSAAALSESGDRKLCSFPPEYMFEDGSVDFEDMQSTIKEGPTMDTLLTNLQMKNYENLTYNFLSLVHFVLVVQPMPQLRLLPEVGYDNLLTRLPPQSKDLQRPLYIFKVNAPKRVRISSNVSSASADARDECSAELNLPFGFYGGNLDEFFMMLNRRSAPIAPDGQSTVLGRDLAGALAKSRQSIKTAGSQLGAEFSCVALYYGTNERTAKGHDAEIEATNSELRYLLLFKNEPPTPETKVETKTSRSLLSPTLGFTVLILVLLIFAKRHTLDICCLSDGDTNEAAGNERNIFNNYQP